MEKNEFENIINSLSKNDLINPEPAKGDDEILTLSEKQKMLAFMGRFLYKGHGGFAEGNPDIVFPEKVKSDFIHAFLTLYQDEQPKTTKEVLADIFKLHMKYIPDNHFYVFNSDGTQYKLAPPEENSFRAELQAMLQRSDIDVCQRGKIEKYLSKPQQVGINIAKNASNIMTNETKGIQWKTGSIHQNGRSFYVIGMSSFVAFNDGKGFDKKLVDDFTHLAHQLSKQEYLNSDALIIDLRQNRGGWPYIGDYLARTLYGNTVTSGGASLKRDTMERALIRGYMTKSSQKDMQQIINQSFSGETKENHDQKWTDVFPFNPEMGVQKPIIVLTDRETGSNAEATCQKLAAHPYVRFIGENTKGCLQFGGAPNGECAIPLPFGGKIGISLGASASDTIQGRFEGIGIAPNQHINGGHDALTQALASFDEIEQDIQRSVARQNFSSVKTDADREDYIDYVTKRNLEITNRMNDKECANAIKRLHNATKYIPQVANTMKAKQLIQQKKDNS